MAATQRLSRLRCSVKPWHVYILECMDGTLYTGISTDVARRYAEHLSGRGARYTRTHPPRRLLISIEFASRSEALKAEYSIKQWNPAAKRAFCLQHTQDDTDPVA